MRMVRMGLPSEWEKGSQVSCWTNGKGPQVWLKLFWGEGFANLLGPNLFPHGVFRCTRSVPLHVIRPPPMCTQFVWLVKDWKSMESDLFFSQEFWKNKGITADSKDFGHNKVSSFNCICLTNLSLGGNNKGWGDDPLLSCGRVRTLWLVLCGGWGGVEK